MKSPNVQFSTCRPYSNPARFLAVPVLMVLCLGVFMAPPVFACHQGKAHGPNTCGGGGGGGPVSGGPTMASFIGPHILDESVARECDPGDLTADAGQFSCSLNEPVQISTFGMTLRASNRHATLCKSLNFFSQNPFISDVNSAPPMTPGVYNYGWTDACTDGACQIVVQLSFSGAAISAATGGKSDAVDLRVSGTLSGTLNGNPFSTPQELAMSHISMQFRKPGSTTIAAVCDWYPQSVEIGIGQHMVFTSEALPASP